MSEYKRIDPLVWWMAGLLLVLLGGICAELGRMGSVLDRLVTP